MPFTNTVAFQNNPYIDQASANRKKKNCERKMCKNNFT